MNSPQITIVGAGIGGLTLGIELRRRGFDVQIWEATRELREVGAAVALSANATRFYLERFGLESELAAAWAEVDGLIHRDGRTGRIVGRHHTRSSYREQFGAPYVGIHRADLQRILAGAFGAEGLHLSKRVITIDDDGPRATLHFEDGDSAQADLVIGADGARSTVRKLMLGYDFALYSGASASRGIVTPEALSELPDPEAIQFWMGPGAHLLHYPIGSGEQNFFLVQRCPAPWPHKSWVVPVEEGSPLEGFRDWHPAVVQMITAVPVTERWGLFHRPPLSRWSRGRITLLGDAAHALVPHHGQGTNQSIEDAIVLADPGMFDRHLSWIHGFRADTEIPDDAAGGTWL